VIAHWRELPAEIAMVTRGGRGRGRVKWKVPDRHAAKHPRLFGIRGAESVLATSC
jgi:hypothetical protein